MAQQGPLLGGTGVTVNYNFGSAIWNAPNQFFAGAGIYGYCSASGTALQYTDFAKVTNFNFSIPDFATILGIEVFYSGHSSISGIGGSVPASAQLVVTDAITGNVIAGGPLFGGQIESITGTPTEWGVPSLTPAQINASNFGFAVYGRFPQAGYEQASIGNMRVKITYTEAPAETMEIISFISMEYLFQKELAAGIALANISEIDILSYISVGFGVDVITPTTGCPAFTNANIEITWTITQGTQAAFRVEVFTDNLGVNKIYDSGIQSGTVGSWIIPPGTLPAPATLYVRVWAQNKDGGTGVSSFVCFETDFPTSVNITGVSVRSVGGCDAPEILPGIRITWMEIIPGGGEVFNRYGIRRRRAGETDFILIAELDDVDTISYIDHNVESRVRYEYGVVWVATAGASYLISANQASNPGAQVDFDFNFLHTANINSQDSDFKWLRIDSWDANVNVQQDIALVQPWGRDLPTVHVGQAIGSKITVPLHPQMLEDKTFWATVTQFILAQRNQAAVLCLRFGRGRQIYFGVLMGSSRGNTQKQFTVNLDFSESYYDQDLTPGLHSGIGSTSIT